jgi:hypothetical protein
MFGAIMNFLKITEDQLNYKLNRAYERGKSVGLRQASLCLLNKAADYFKNDDDHLAKKFKIVSDDFKLTYVDMDKKLESTRDDRLEIIDEIAFKDFVSEGCKIPLGYGLAYIDFAKNQGVCFPFGIHIIIALIYRFYCFLLCRIACTYIPKKQHQMIINDKDNIINLNNDLINLYKDAINKNNINTER